jgi:hypothetical protein
MDTVLIERVIAAKKLLVELEEQIKKHKNNLNELYERKDLISTFINKSEHKSSSDKPKTFKTDLEKNEKLKNIIEPDQIKYFVGSFEPQKILSSISEGLKNSNLNNTYLLRKININNNCNFKDCFLVTTIIDNKLSSDVKITDLLKNFKNIRYEFIKSAISALESLPQDFPKSQNNSYTMIFRYPNPNYQVNGDNHEYLFDIGNVNLN